MSFLKRVVRTWTFWYLLLPAVLYPILDSLDPPQTRPGEIASGAAWLLIVQDLPPIYLVQRASQTLEPLWMIELACCAWAFLGGSIAASLVRRAAARPT